jgi:hypothetical protein
MGSKRNDKCSCCLSACTRMDESRILFWPLTPTSGTRICRLYRDTWLRIDGRGFRLRERRMRDRRMRERGGRKGGEEGRRGERERETSGGKVLSSKLERVLACVMLTSDLLNGHTNLGRQ